MIDPKTHSMNNVYIATMIFWKEDSSKNKVATDQNDEEKMLVKN